MEINQNYRVILQQHLNQIEQIESLIKINVFALKEPRPKNKEFSKLRPKILTTVIIIFQGNGIDGIA